ncbi:MAG: 1-deoxy-D-xylulose-5-phosphate reductoisomerase [Eubacteriales bacterium]|nr:1-deoxy-D-xylulose-5-phosphate reductoisomerase [Eubacteriales bacterium]MDD3874005.1 1-deoxy-D-xylulose-5-phosphate reductoisomerase [Methanosarcina sp.]MDD4582650.1 1-deoxy-D-xylulose-5-phosphate reductoisomerase [Eubacteriales bacterium]
MKKIGILGSTGSIGTQALEIIRKNPTRFSVTALTCGRNFERLAEQIVFFNPQVVCVELEEDALTLQKKFPRLEVLWGEKGLIEVAEKADCDLLLNALVGMRGLAPTYAGIRAGKNIALANKETLVAGGEIVMEAVKEKGATFLPVDSEHSAIFQALEGNRDQEIRKILLTASGGPFRGYSYDQLKQVTVEQALKHPNWSMGSKITIDSATMMNKGLEVIEAHWLFSAEAEKIQVVVHKESIIHSMVEYMDHSILAQLGQPDMEIPISYAFTYPDRLKNDLCGVNFFALGTLSFEPVDTSVFRCLDMAYLALKYGGSYPVVLNAANEILVQQFLEKKISFIEIQNTIERILDDHEPVYNLELLEILEIDKEIRERFEKWD